MRNRKQQQKKNRTKSFKNQHVKQEKGVKKFSFKEKQEFEKLEKEISDLENEKAELADKLNSGTGSHLKQTNGLAVAGDK